MELNITTDYALRVLLCLVMEQRPMGAAELSAKVKISQTYITIIMSKLKKGGFVSAKRGQVGGYYLVKRPEDITMWDVIEVMERSPKISCCLPEDYKCAYLDISKCPIRGAYANAQTHLEESFRHFTLAQLGESLRNAG
jgi:Rrf2 family nitric oxide-sensitive transcriptional repressor